MRSGSFYSYSWRNMIPSVYIKVDVYLI